MREGQRRNGYGRIQLVELDQAFVYHLMAAAPQRTVGLPARVDRGCFAPKKHGRLILLIVFRPGTRDL